MKNMSKPIVIFDSGVGGLSIYQEIRRKLPNTEVIYCADNLGFPYGPKPESFVINRTLHCLNSVTNQYKPQLIVIACNTASTVALPSVRSSLKIPIVGVVPAIKVASQYSSNRCFGLLATPGTINRKYTKKLVQDFANDCHVISVGSNALVSIAERYLRRESVTIDEVKEVLLPFFSTAHQPDCIVLGCTHFPLLKEYLMLACPIDIKWVDSGEAVARRVKHLIDYSSTTSQGYGNTFVFTGECDDSIENLISPLKSMGFTKFNALESNTPPSLLFDLPSPLSRMQYEFK